MSEKQDSGEYGQEEKGYWNQTILPALDKLKVEMPENEDLQFLDMVIRNRQFLAIKDFKINIGGVTLRISPVESKETALAKLQEFLGAIQEKKDESEDIYTSEDQKFWRENVIPSLDELKAKHGKEPGFRLLTLMIEKRMLSASSKKAGLDITIKGVHLKTEQGDKKKDIQRKLSKFLRVLKGEGGSEEMGEAIVEVRDEVKEKLKGNWKTIQKKRTAEAEEVGLEGKYRYNANDQILWRNYIVPNLEGLTETYKNHKELEALVGAIYERKFLTGGNWKMTVEGIELDVKKSDAQDVKQEKLKKFLVELQEATYTRPDKEFWNRIVLPGLVELQKVYKDDKEFQLLVMTIEERLFHKSRKGGILNISIGGVTLKVEVDDNKLSAQEKLKTFIEELKRKSEGDQVNIIKQEMNLRIERLEGELKRHETRNRKLEKENELLEEKRKAFEREVGKMRVEITKVERRAQQAESEASSLRSSGYSNYRPSYSSGGE